MEQDKVYENSLLEKSWLNSNDLDYLMQTSCAILEIYGSPPCSQLKQASLCKTNMETVQRHNLLFCVPGAGSLNFIQTWSRVRKTGEGESVVGCMERIYKVGSLVQS